jgi:hypothetical protein
VATFSPANDALFDNFVFTVTGPIAPQSVVVTFLNDGATGGVNRDLWLDFIEVDGARFETETTALNVFDLNGVEQQIVGREAMFRNGSMVFDDLSPIG